MVIQDQGEGDVGKVMAKGGTDGREVEEEEEDEEEEDDGEEDDGEEEGEEDADISILTEADEYDEITVFMERLRMRMRMMICILKNSKIHMLLKKEDRM